MAGVTVAQIAQQEGERDSLFTAACFVVVISQFKARYDVDHNSTSFFEPELNSSEPRVAL